MKKEKWMTEQMPSLEGKTVVVTGANSGLGYISSLELARKGAKVVLACRSLERGEQARQAILQEVPYAELILMKLDLADLSNVHTFAENLLAETDRLDVLMNNAGLMNIPRYQTADGFEMLIGTNHLGPFALTGLLFERLLETPESRVVTISSLGHLMVRSIRFDDLMWEKNYLGFMAYGQSKLANLLFAFELQRRFERAGSSSRSIAAHPGYTSTNLFHLDQRPRKMTPLTPLIRAALYASLLVSQPVAEGALPQLYAATSPEALGGHYYGPDGLLEMRGAPREVRASQSAYDLEAAQQLWKISQELTGVVY